jgi:predicted nucleotidyltransferase
VIKWPKADEVVAALKEWAKTAARRVPGIRRVGYIGSYARGDWGVGSDLDVVVIIGDDPRIDPDQVARLETCSIPVPVDLQVFRESRWKGILQGATLFSRALERECTFVLE